MKFRVTIPILCLCILALISSICFSSQGEEKVVDDKLAETHIIEKEDSGFIMIEDNNEESNKENEVTYANITEKQEMIRSLDFDADEAEMLQKIAMAEAGGEGKECMALVMLTVLNRTWSDKFPNSIYGVIHQTTNGTYQFTPVANGAYAAAIPSNECKEALNMVMSGWNESQNALYFESCSGSSWHSRNLQYLYSCGRMKFYK